CTVICGEKFTWTFPEEREGSVAGLVTDLPGKEADTGLAAVFFAAGADDGVAVLPDGASCLPTGGVKIAPATPGTTVAGETDAVLVVLVIAVADPSVLIPIVVFSQSGMAFFT
ncbi:hypothetical protein, partial [Escherichia coli]|uniref:hypothetical protein n=1 Tax=Escherichia coli TaxID=562 RepID=UPI001595B241